jgi:hypothetical protein
MGNNQSRPFESDAAVTEKLAERLRAMQLEHEKDGYLVVNKPGTYQYLVILLTECRLPV